MINKHLTLLLLNILLLTSCQSYFRRTDEHKLEKICGHFYVQRKHHFYFENTFTQNEKLLICGSDVPGWKDIPENQAEYFLKSFLNDRGFFKTQLIRENDKIIILMGEKNKIRTIDFKNTPEGFFDSKFISIINEPLTPDNIEKIESWTLNQLRNHGYPCPSLKTQVDTKNEQVTVQLFPGEKERVENIELIHSTQISEGGISRFHAFPFGSFYNGQNFSLTSRRLMQSGLVDYSDFHNNCKIKDRRPNHFEHKLSFGYPRQFILNFGGTTEEYPIAKATWKHNRLDQHGSNGNLDLYFSSVKQSLNGLIHWHTFKNNPRFYWTPNLSITRYSELLYETLSQKLSLGLGQDLDDSKNQYRWSISPTYNIEKTLVGSGPDNTSFFSLESRMTLTSHDYEYFISNPQKGSHLSLDWSNRQKGLGSEINANRYLLEGTYLNNWGGFKKPLIVFGLRFKYGVYDSNDRVDTPASYRLYLGGDDDLRGFPRKSINNNSTGLSSFAYLGSEIRFLSLIPYDLQPFILFDIAKIAVNNLNYLPATLMSPGAGMRWQSPFGSLRTTLAYGMIDNHRNYHLGPTEQWKFFLSFGKEF